MVTVGTPCLVPLSKVNGLEVQPLVITEDVGELCSIMGTILQDYPYKGCINGLYLGCKPFINH